MLEKAVYGLATRFPVLKSPMVAPAAWGLVAVAAGAAVAPLEPNLLEEGIVVHTAERMLSGEHLYRDVAIHTGPLPYEFLALLFRLFGPEIAVARGAVVALQGIATALVYAVARRAGAGPFAHPAAAAVAGAPVLLVPLLSTFFYTTLAFYLAIIAVYAGVRSAASPRWAVAAGALVAGVALCKQTSGVVFAATLLPAVALAAPSGLRLARAAAVIGGGCAIAALTIAVYALRGDLGPLFHSLIELPAAIAAADSFRSPFINLWPLGVLEEEVRASWTMYLPNLYYLRYGLFTKLGWSIVAAAQLLFALPFAALALTLLRGLVARLDPALWLHAALLATMTFNLYPRADWGHLVVALPPALVQILLLTAPTRAAHSARRRRLAAAGLVGVLTAGSAVTAVWLHGIAGPPTFGPRVPLRPLSEGYRGPGVSRVIEYLRSHARPGEPIFVARSEPLLYFATGTRNPTPFEGVFPGLREMQETTIVAALEDLRFAVMSDVDQPFYTYYSDELPAVQAYLERYFEVPPDFTLDEHSWMSVLRRDRDRGPTAIDLIEEQPKARAWIRDRRGAERPVTGRPQRLAARQLRRLYPVVLGAAGGGVDFELEIPKRAVFQAGVGYHFAVSVDHHYFHAPGTTFVVSVRSKGRFAALESVRIGDGRRPVLRWIPVEVDLSGYAGRRVTLRLEWRSERLARWGSAWVGSPRIALRPDGG